MQVIYPLSTMTGDWHLGPQAHPSKIVVGLETNPCLIAILQEREASRRKMRFVYRKTPSNKTTL